MNYFRLLRCSKLGKTWSEAHGTPRNTGMNIQDDNDEEDNTLDKHPDLSGGYYQAREERYRATHGLMQLPIC